MKCPTCGHHPPALNDDRLRHALLAAVAPGITDDDLADEVADAITPNDFDTIEDSIANAIIRP